MLILGSGVVSFSSTALDTKSTVQGQPNFPAGGAGNASSILVILGNVLCKKAIGKHLPMRDPSHSITKSNQSKSKLAHSLIDVVKNSAALIEALEIHFQYTIFRLTDRVLSSLNDA